MRGFTQLLVGWRLFSFANTNFWGGATLSIQIHYELIRQQFFVCLAGHGRYSRIDVIFSALFWSPPKWVLHTDPSRLTCLHMPHVLPTSRASNHTLPIYPEACLHQDSATITRTAETGLDLHSATTNSRTERHQLQYRRNLSTLSSIPTTCLILGE